VHNELFCEFPKSIQNIPQNLPFFGVFEQNKGLNQKWLSPCFCWRRGGRFEAPDPEFIHILELLNVAQFQQLRGATCFSTTLKTARTSSIRLHPGKVSGKIPASSLHSGGQ